MSVEVGELGASVMYFNAISVGAEKDLNGVDSKKHPKGIRPEQNKKHVGKLQFGVFWKGV